MVYSVCVSGCPKRCKADLWACTFSVPKCTVDCPANLMSCPVVHLRCAAHCRSSVVHFTVSIPESPLRWMGRVVQCAHDVFGFKLWCTAAVSIRFLDVAQRTKRRTAGVFWCKGICLQYAVGHMADVVLCAVPSWDVLYDALKTRFLKEIVSWNV